jgi:predicted RNA binding protein YcfA (HicA-like mRNA interferase family)
MSKLPVLKAQELIRILESTGFEVIRQKGSHVRMKHPDNRLVTIPVHPGQDIGRGLLRKILRDAELTRQEFIALFEK